STNALAPPGGRTAGAKAPTFGRPRRAAVEASTAFETDAGSGLRATSGRANATSVLLTGFLKKAPPPAAISATYWRPSRPRYVSGLECLLASSFVSHNTFPAFESKARKRASIVAP